MKFFWTLLLVFATGCARMETAKSVSAADVLLASAQDALSTPAEDPAPSINRAVVLIAQARRNLAPAVPMLAEGQPVDPGISQELVLRDQASALAQAQKQAGRAEVEVEQARFWWQAKDVVVRTVGAITGGDWLATLLAALGGAGGVGAIALKLIMSAKSQVAVARKAVVDAATYGDAMETAETDADVQRVKNLASAVQARNGTADLIAKLRGKA